MFDRRYPNLHRIDYAPGVPYLERKSLAAFARRVAQRTGTKECWDAATGAVYFYNGTPDRGVHRVHTRRAENNIRIPGVKEEDASVRYIQMCRRSAAEKNRELAFAERDHQNAAADALPAKLAEGRKDAEDLVGSIRRGRKSVTVNGVKGNRK